MTSPKTQSTGAGPDPVSRWRPYVELARIEKPIGIANFYLPALFGTQVAAILKSPVVHPYELIHANLILLLEAAIIRGLLCTWNDILDRDLDKQVARTRLRPLPRGAVTVRSALVFCVLQAALAAAPFRFFRRPCALTGLPFLALHIIYPWAKRVTNYPQLVLGLAKAGGAVLAFPILGVRVDLRVFDRHGIALGALCIAILAWVTMWDTIYSAQDVADDKKAGIKSTMVAHEGHARSFLRGIAFVKILSLVVLGFALNCASEQAGTAFLGLLCLTSVPLVTAMVEDVELASTSSCAWWFSKGNLAVGFSTAVCLGFAYVVRLSS